MGHRIGQFKSLNETSLREREADFLDIASDVPHEYWRLENFLMPLEKKWDLSFYLPIDGLPKAYLIASERNGKCHIHHFMVHRTLRSQGIGSMMLAEARQRALDNGLLQMSVKVFKANTRARAFYARHGFEIFEENAGKDGAYLLLTRDTARRRVVAIHQPNYVPWLGYFSKIAKADIFVFLDDVQFTKGGYTNRVKILSPAGPRWITVPVSVHLGDLICEVEISRDDWVRSHMSLLRGCYRQAPRFNEVWGELQEIYSGATQKIISELNTYLLRRLCARIGLEKEFHLSSSFDVRGKGDERLVALMQRVAPGGTYLSGKGGAKYQEPRKFLEAGFGFRYVEFEHPIYDQGGEKFQEGLSVLDAVFHTGFEGAAAFLEVSTST